MSTCLLRRHGAARAALDVQSSTRNLLLAGTGSDAPRPLGALPSKTPGKGGSPPSRSPPPPGPAWVPSAPASPDPWIHPPFQPPPPNPNHCHPSQDGSNSRMTGSFAPRSVFLRQSEPDLIILPLKALQSPSPQARENRNPFREVPRLLRRHRLSSPSSLPSCPSRSFTPVPLQLPIPPQPSGFSLKVTSPKTLLWLALQSGPPQPAQETA